MFLFIAMSNPQRLIVFILHGSGYIVGSIIEENHFVHDPGERQPVPVHVP